MTIDRKDPWESLELPEKDGDLTATRVDPSSFWDFYWSLSHQGHPQLTLLHDQHLKGKLPSFDGFKVTNRPNSDGRQILSFTLEEDLARDIFHTLCIDLVSVTNTCKNELAAVKESVNRAWSWHRLLKGRHDSRLSHNEQQGLMGELYIIRQAIKVTNSDDVVVSWKAPEENAKDFIYGERAIEVKSRRNAHSSSIRITSAEQLDACDFDAVFLAIVTMSIDPTQGFDLHSYARTISQELAELSPSASAIFDQKVVHRGLWPEHDYQEDRWIFTSVDFYVVSDQFPRIQASELTAGVNNVTYAIEINAIKPFTINEDKVFIRAYGQEV